MPECFCTWAGQTENLPSQKTAEIQLFSHECDRPTMLLLQTWWNVLQSFRFFPQLEVSWQMHFPSGSPDNGPQTQAWPFAQRPLHLASAGRTRAGKSLAKRNKPVYLVFISFVKPITCIPSSLMARTSVCARRAGGELPWITGEPLLMLLLLVRVTWTHAAVPQGLTTHWLP